MTDKQLADAAALQLAADWTRAGNIPPESIVTGYALIEDCIVISVTIRKHERAQLFYDERGRACIGTPPPEPPVHLSKPAERILAVAPAVDGTPITLKRLARLAGYSYSEWFREHVDTLVAAKLLTRSKHGVKKAA